MNRISLRGREPEIAEDPHGALAQLLQLDVNALDHMKLIGIAALSLRIARANLEIAAAAGPLHADDACEALDLAVDDITVGFIQLSRQPAPEPGDDQSGR